VLEASKVPTLVEATILEFPFAKLITLLLGNKAYYIPHTVTITRVVVMTTGQLAIYLSHLANKPTGQQVKKSKRPDTV
jgi:hypothetical protein